MNLGIIHLSDFHFKGESLNEMLNPDLVERIAAAVKTDLIEATHIAIIVSGDIAYSGLEKEYECATDWLSFLYTRIDDECDAQCTIICAPGNHDVDHSNENVVRSALISQILKNPDISKDKSVVSQCTKHQSAFFGFINELEGEEILVHNERLLRIHRIRDKESTIQINVLNSAWMSSLREDPGTIVFPIEQFNDVLQVTDGFSISVLHHPVSWFTTDSCRDLREHLFKCSSIILFGHEHKPDSLHLITQHSDNVHIVDGGVIDTNNYDDCTFNLILLDTVSRKLQQKTFSHRSKRFECTEDYGWKDATRLTSSESSRFRLVNEKRYWMEDVGANILHPRHESVKLKDVYVYPDLLPMSFEEDSSNESWEKTESAETLIYNLHVSHVILEGQENSGKTSLLRMFFLEFYQRGKIPILLQGDEVTGGNGKRLQRALKNSFERTYEGEDYTQYCQLNPDDRVILIDEFEVPRKNFQGQRQVLKFIQKFSSKSILAGKDILSMRNQLDAMVGTGAFQGVSLYAIQEFGHVKRDELIKRWILLGRESSDWNLSQTLGERDRARLIINSTIGQNLMPSHPIISLILLQSMDLASANHIGKTYGHYYQFLVTNALIGCGFRPEDLDAVLNYLSEFAFSEFYLPSCNQVTHSNYIRWHASFCDEYGVEFDSSKIRELLLRANLVSINSEGQMKFKYKYVYYFFLAKRLSRYIDQEKIRQSIRHMCNRLHVDEYANVVLFLIHHSDDKFVLETLRDSANSLLRDQDQFKFEISESNLNLNLINQLSTPPGVRLLEDRNPDDEQARELRERDLVESQNREIELVSQSEGKTSQPMEALDLLAQAGVSAKTVELVGQVLRNYYGSLKVDRKLELGNDATKLALRALHSIFDAVISSDYEVVEEIVEMRRQYELDNLPHSDRKSEKELYQWSKDFCFSFFRFITHAIIRKVAGSLGSDQLKPTLKELVVRGDSIAYDLVEIAALLESPDDIPTMKITSLVKRLKNNPLAYQVLRDFAAQRVYRYPIQYKDKQWLAEKLNFSIVKQRNADMDQSRRILSSRK